MGVTKIARQLVLGHDAQPDLVGHQHHRARHAREGVNEMRRLRLRVAAVGHEVAEPKGEAVDDHRHMGVGLAGKRSGEVEGLLDGAPSIAAPGAMLRDSRRHLGVAGLGGGDVDRARPGAGRGNVLGIGALARARAAQHQGDFRKHWHTC